MSLLSLFHLKYASLSSPPTPTLQFSHAWVWPCNGEGIVFLWGRMLAPSLDQWSLDWYWHSIYWKMVRRCHSSYSLECVAQNRFVLNWWDWAGSARPTQPLSCLSTCLCGRDWAELCELDLEDVYFKQYGPPQDCQRIHAKRGHAFLNFCCPHWMARFMLITGHSLAQDLYLSTSGNRMTTCFHALQLKWLLWKARMLFRHYLISTVSALQKISVTLSIFTR